MATGELCPCGSSKTYVECCGRYLDEQQIAATAEQLMRSRYTAYTLLREDYLLATWHESTRPVALNLADEAPTQWLGLKIKSHRQQTGTAIVAFVARYKINGRAYRLQEISSFARGNDGRWFYVDGKIAVN